MQELEASDGVVNASIDATITAMRIESLRLALNTDAAATSNQFAKV
jgi:hypothetical protein